MADRFIRYGDKEFPLEPGMTLDQAKDVMARHFPELADPKVETKKHGDKTVYVFSKRAGHKGARSTKRLQKQKPANTAILRQLEKVRAGICVDVRLIDYVTRGDGDYEQALQMARKLRDETVQVVQIRKSLFDLPNSIIPTGSIL